ncbi:hypothetical protein J1792_25510 [Streptomyces triculaminicus]|uniref:Diaminopimelate epimerase n=1 Tax=Streptomyces triculaminicus TaxID=2816232 RepID=A0A939FU06_9ACTN|nr:hypothetical protein [Streptomyces triculaminicus]
MLRAGVEPGPRYAKGYCGGNGFVILLDPDNRVPLSEAAARALCTPHTGLGGDGVLRLVRTARAGVPGLTRSEWFMDCRDPDGSRALMCAPGLGLVARYLTLVGLAPPGRMWIGTRVGDKRAAVGPDGRATMELLPPRVLGPSSATVDGRTLPGTAVSLGNLHRRLPGQPAPGLPARDARGVRGPDPGPAAGRRRLPPDHRRHRPGRRPLPGQRPARRPPTGARPRAGRRREALVRHRRVRGGRRRPAHGRGVGDHHRGERLRTAVGDAGAQRADAAVGRGGHRRRGRTGRGLAGRAVSEETTQVPANGRAATPGVA